MPDEKKTTMEAAPKRKVTMGATRLYCHAPHGTLTINGMRVRYKRGDTVENPSKDTIASADPASWELVKG